MYLFIRSNYKRRNKIPFSIHPEVFRVPLRSGVKVNCYSWIKVYDWSKRFKSILLLPFPDILFKILEKGG